MSNKKYLVLAVGIALAAVVTTILVWPRPAEDLPGRELTRSELELRDGRLFVPGEEEPFDGTLVEYFAGQTMKASIEIKDGNAHGVTRGWYESGQVEVEEHFTEGVSHGLRTRWHANGQKRSEVEVVDGKLSGQYAEWYDNGTKAAQAYLVDGKADGLSEAWHRSGKLKSRVKLNHGEVVSREYFEEDPS